MEITCGLAASKKIGVNTVKIAKQPNTSAVFRFINNAITIHSYTRERQLPRVKQETIVFRLGN